MALSAIWAAILMLTSLCTNASGLWAGRFCLGFVEAAIAPGMTMIISMWYKRSEQTLRQSVWFMGNVTGGFAVDSLDMALDTSIASHPGRSVEPHKGVDLYA